MWSTWRLWKQRQSTCKNFTTEADVTASLRDLETSGRGGGHECFFLNVIGDDRDAPPEEFRLDDPARRQNRWRAASGLQDLLCPRVLLDVDPLWNPHRVLDPRDNRPVEAR